MNVTTVPNARCIKDGQSILFDTPVTPHRAAHMQLSYPARHMRTKMRYEKEKNNLNMKGPSHVEKLAE